MFLFVCVCRETSRGHIQLVSVSCCINLFKYQRGLLSSDIALELKVSDSRGAQEHHAHTLCGFVVF